MYEGGTGPVTHEITEPAAFEWPGGLRPRVFISYRRALSQEQARGLRRELEHHLPGQVFMDDKSLRSGWDWSQWLDRALKDPGLKVVVCIVHPDFWTHPFEGTSDRRLWDENDVVLRELRIAVERWKNEKDKSFNLILAPQSEGSDLPTIEGEMPAWTREVLEVLPKVHLSHSYRMNWDDGFDALVKGIVEDVHRLGAQTHDNVRTFSDLLGLEDGERHGLRTSLEQKIAQGNREPRTVALAAALAVLYGDFDAAEDRLRKDERVFAKDFPAGEAQYWRTLAAATLVATVLRGERPRRLSSLKLARELAARLDRALRDLDAHHADLERAEFSDAARSTAAVAALALHRIVGDYFKGRGISLTTGGGVRENEYIDGMLAWTRDVMSRAEVDDQIAGLVPAPDSHELESGARMGA